MKLIIYQTFPRILTNNNEHCVPNGTLEENGSGKFNDITPTVLNSIKELGVNAIWYTGVLEMATKSDYSKYGIKPDNKHVVKGEAGSPYAIKDYYDVDPALATDVDNRMAEFEALVERTHKAGLKCIIDFVPNHTAREYHSDNQPSGIKQLGEDDDPTMCFSPTNDYYYITNQQFSPSIDLTSGEDPYVEFPAKATGNDCFSAFCSEYDWYETVKLNYGRDYGNWSGHYNPIPPLWHKMANILRYWAGKGVDGFRCDMVFMVPLEFWNWVIPMVKRDYPDTIFIGEIYNVSEYRPFLEYGHFDYLYDKVNLYDTLVNIERHNYSAAQLTGCWQTVDGIGDKMVNFLENHDEVRFGSVEFSGNPASVIPSLVVSTMMSKSPFLLYYGQELGERATDNEGFAGNNNRSTIFDYWSYGTLRRWYSNGKCDGAIMTPQEKWLRSVYQKVLSLCNTNKALSKGSFYDLMYVNLQNVHFNPHRNFAFLRHVKGELLLIVANFGNEAAELDINIPIDAFNFLNLPQLKNVKAIDLLTGTPQLTSLVVDSPTRVNVEAKNAVVLQITYKKRKADTTKK